MLSEFPQVLLLPGNACVSVTSKRHHGDGITRS